jgi:DNA ligase (NAD+)
MDKENFKALNHYRKGQGEACYKTPRTAVVAALQRDDLKAYPAKLTLIDYMYYTHFMKAKDFKHNWKHVYSVIRNYPFPMDGIVIKLSDQKYAESLGVTEHHPRSMVAFKFASSCKDSIIRRVRWQFAAKGLIPVAEFDAVQLGDRNICRATLHNAAYVKKNDICIGDTILVKLSGDSIPIVTLKAKGDKRQHALPDKCPECGEKLVMKSIHLYCSNKSCPGMIYGCIRKELQRNRIKGLGDKTLMKLIKVCGIKNKDELAALNKKQLQQVPGITGKRAEKLYAAIQTWSQLMSN